MEALRRIAGEVMAEGPLPEVKALRDFDPADRVAARIELTARAGLLRRREAGLDVRGDGSLVPYAGAIRKQPLPIRGGESAFDAIRRTLEESGV